MIIETDPPLLLILVVWGGGVNNQETTLDYNAKGVRLSVRARVRV